MLLSNDSQKLKKTENNSQNCIPYTNCYCIFWYPTKLTLSILTSCIYFSKSNKIGDIHIYFLTNPHLCSKQIIFHLKMSRQNFFVSRGVNYESGTLYVQQHVVLILIRICGKDVLSVFNCMC